MERPDYVPDDFVLVKAEDGCTYWATPKAVGNSDYFVLCTKTEDETKDEAWHAGNELKEV